MANTGARLVFFGNERIATGVTTEAPVLQALIAAGYDVAVVVVAQADASKSRKHRRLEVAEVAEAHNIPVVTAKKMSEMVDDLKKVDAQAGVLVAFGKIVPQAVIDIFPRGIINIHPSLLPEHRGPTPLESVLIKNEEETGVSLMALADKMDAGPLYAQKKVKLTGKETKQELADKLLNLGKDMLLDCLPGILDGSLKPQNQDDAYATYDQRLSKDDAVLDWMHKPAEEIERQIRTHQGWPRSRGLIGTTEVVITEVHISPLEGVAGTLFISPKEFGVHTTKGTIIIDKLIPPGRNEMSGVAFLAGYHPV